MDNTGRIAELRDGQRNRGAEGRNAGLVRFTEDGAVDTTLGGGSGYVQRDLGGSSLESFQALAYVDVDLDGDGDPDEERLLASGTSANRFFVARLDPSDLSLDAAFGASGGYTVTNVEFGSSTGRGAAYAIAVQADGRIVAAGEGRVTGGSTADFAVVRYTPDGLLDATLDGDGLVMTDIDGNKFDVGSAAAFDDSGRLVVAGTRRGSTVSSPGDLALARYLVDVDDALEERLYAQTDANHNVTSLADETGNVTQRFVYDPYGSAKVLSPAWSSTMLDGFTPVADAYQWSYRHQGGRLDAATGLYHFRHRDYSPTLGNIMHQPPSCGPGFGCGRR